MAKNVLRIEEQTLERSNNRKEESQIFCPFEEVIELKNDRS